MMRRDENGMSDFMVEAPEASVVELTIDFGNGFVRTLAMKRTDDRTWTIRVHGVSDGVRYRFRVDGRSIPEPDAFCDGPDGWTRITRAA